MNLRILTINESCLKVKRNEMKVKDHKYRKRKENARLSVVIKQSLNLLRRKGGEPGRIKNLGTKQYFKII